MPTNISLVACLFNTNGKNLFGLHTNSVCLKTDRQSHKNIEANFQGRLFDIYHMFWSMEKNRV